jgi:glutaredoxin
MKLLNLIFILCLSLSALAQSKDVELIKTENGQEVTYSAKSLSKETLILELTITGTGFTTNVSLPLKLELLAFEKKEAVKITLGESASYNISYKITKSSPGGNISSGAKTDKINRPNLEKGIVVFSKDGCGKCTYAKNYLKEKGKAFIELNISQNDQDQSYMWQKLQDAGFSGGTVQTPVFMVEGKMHFNMDLKLFLADIK